MNITHLTSILRKPDDYLSKRWISRIIKDMDNGYEHMRFLEDDPIFQAPWTQNQINAYHNARDPGDSLKYNLNPNLWCIDYADQLSCVIIGKDDGGTSFVSASGQMWHTRYGMIPITKRHVVCAGHATTHAAGTWGPNINQTVPTRLRWRDKNGDTVDRIQLHQATAYVGSNEANSYGTDYKDITVAVLDEDLPDTIHIPRIVPNSPKYRSASYNYKNGIYTYNVPEVFSVSQEWNINSQWEQNKYWGNYEIVNGVPNYNSFVPNYIPDNMPLYHRSMLYPSSSINKTFNYRVWGGDSGSPQLAVIGGELMFHKIVSGFSPFYHNPPLTFGSIDQKPWEWYVNTLINLADDNAIAKGRLSERTGYTVTVAD